MPPMFRRLFKVLSALSLLLCAAEVVLWVRSFWTGTAVAEPSEVRLTRPFAPRPLCELAGPLTAGGTAWAR